MTDTTLRMTPARWTILVAGAPVVLGVLALCTWLWVRVAVHRLADLSPRGYSVQFHAPASPDGVRLTLTNGDLTYRTGHGKNIYVIGNLTGSLAAPAFSHTVTAAGLIMNPTCRAPIGICDITFTATGPAGLPIDLSDTYGQLNASALHGDIALTSNSGNISASHLAGAIRLNDSYGEIDVARLSGAITIKSNSGDINAAGLSGDTQISDDYGSVNVTGLAATDVRCTANSGDVTIVFATIPKNVQVTDSYGSVTLQLPDTSTAYDVSTKNPNGSTSVLVPHNPNAQNKITVYSNSGDITISRQGPHSSTSSTSSRPTPVSAG